MPKVAQYQPGQVQTAVVRGPRMPALTPDFSPVAQGVFDIGKSFADIKQRVDITSAEEALNNFEKAKNDILFNPETGYYNTQGKNAFDSAQDTRTTIEKLKVQFGDGLNSSSRKLFDKVADQHITRTSADIMRHSAKGLKAWEIATIESQVENTMENAALYWNNSKDLKIQRILGEQAIHESAKLSGIGPEATNEKLQTYRSKFMASAISAATVQSSEKGQEIFDSNKDLLEPQDQVKLQKEIDTKKQNEQTKFNAVQATLTATRLVDEYDSRRDIQTEVNKIEDPELRQKTMSEAMSLYSRKRQIESEERADAFEAAEQFMLQGGTAVAYQAQNPETWSKLSPGQQKALTADKVVETNWNTYSGLMTLPKEALAKINPVDYFDQLGKTERRSLISAVKTAKGGGSEEEKTDTQVGRTRAAEVKSAVIQIFGKEKDYNDKDLKMVDSFYSLVDSEVRYREEVKGSKLTSAEFTDVLAGFTRDYVSHKGVLWDTITEFQDIPTEEIPQLTEILRGAGLTVTTEALGKLQKGLSSAKIPFNDAVEISKFLKANKIPVTGENIVKAYKQAGGTTTTERNIPEPDL